MPSGKPLKLAFSCGRKTELWVGLCALFRITIRGLII
uniref:Uncharacterized protein n=1 Tax=Rhizophora mucronata TaxID=61149 RepID=A0A2P2QNA3_RHIMU